MTCYKVSGIIKKYKIVELLNEYDLVKEFGEGVDRIYRDMKAAGLHEPEYRQSGFMLNARLRNQNYLDEECNVSCDAELTDF